MHQQALDLIFSEIEPVFPDVAVLEITVLLGLDIVRMGGKVALEPSNNTQNGEDKTIIGGDVGGIIDGIGENACLLGLTSLIDAQKQMAEHRGGVIHVGGRKDECNRRGIQLSKPRVKALARLRKQTAFVNGNSHLEA